MTPRSAPQILAAWAQTNKLRPATFSAWLVGQAQRTTKASAIALLMDEVDGLIKALVPGVAEALDVVRQDITEPGIEGHLSTPAALGTALEHLWDTLGAPALQDALLIPLQAFAETSAEQSSPAPATKQGASLGVQEAIRAALAQNIAGISEATRAAIRGIIETVRDSDLTNLQQARQIREAIGLTAQQASQLAKLHAELIADGQEPRRISRLLRQTSQTMKMERALVIVETEAVTSLAVGQQALWEEQAREEEIPVEQFRRFWVTAPGACAEICSPIPNMNPTGVALEEAFNTPIGPLMYPAAHPRCRCVVESEVVD